MDKRHALDKLLVTTNHSTYTVATMLGIPHTQVTRRVSVVGRRPLKVARRLIAETQRRHPTWTRERIAEETETTRDLVAQVRREIGFDYKANTSRIRAVTRKLIYRLCRRNMHLNIRELRELALAKGYIAMPTEVADIHRRAHARDCGGLELPTSAAFELLSRRWA